MTTKKGQTKNDEKRNQEPAADDGSDLRIDELTQDVKRIQAEFVNYKNRVEEEKATVASFTRINTIKALLPIIDDLERALSHRPDNLKGDKWADGIDSVYSRLLKQLDKLGVSLMQAENSQFDPNLHEAVQVEGEGDNQVVSEVLQNGYMIGDQVLRHAVVKVKNS